MSFFDVSGLGHLSGHFEMKDSLEGADRGPWDPMASPILILDIRIGDSGALYSMAGVGFVSRYSQIWRWCVWIEDKP